MHISTTPTPPVTPKKKDTNDVANSRGDTIPSRRVQYNPNKTELNEFQRAALALANMSPVQYLNTQRHAGHSVPHELSVAEEVEVEAKYESDSGDEVEFVRWLTPQELATEVELIGLFKAHSLNTQPQPVAQDSRSCVNTASPAAIRSQKGPSKMSTTRPESPALISLTPRPKVPTSTSHPAVQSSDQASQELSVIPNAAVLYLPPGPHMQKKRYYVVTTGKCAGIYYDTWNCVKVLTEFVPKAKYHGYSTYRDARKAYADAKEHGEIEIIRFPGDDAIFGPLGSAIQ